MDHISPEVRAFAWARFAASSLQRSGRHTLAAGDADELLKDFDARFPANTRELVEVGKRLEETASRLFELESTLGVAAQDDETVTDTAKRLIALFRDGAKP